MRTKYMIQVCPKCDKVFNAKLGLQKCDYCKERLSNPFEDNYGEAIRDTGHKGNCQVCKKKTDRLVRDHDHSCHKKTDDMCPRCFRGWICNSCNSGLGFFNDSPELLRMAALYIEHHKAVKVPWLKWSQKLTGLIAKRRFLLTAVMLRYVPSVIYGSLPDSTSAFVTVAEDPLRRRSEPYTLKRESPQSPTGNPRIRVKTPLVREQNERLALHRVRPSAWSLRGKLLSLSTTRRVGRSR